MKIKTFICLLIPIIFLLTACEAGTKYPVPCPAPPILADEAGEDTVVFTIRNRTCSSINAVNIAAKDCNDYGVDQLDGQNIPSGWELSIDVLPGIYDVWIEECTGDNGIIEKIDISESYIMDYFDPNVKDPADCQASITVVNNSDKPICHMWIASPRSDRFGMNWLSDGDQIAPSESRVFVVDETTYDIKAESCDWDQLRLQLDVPVSSQITWEVPEE
jgi:hypothetical protein